MYKKMRMGLNRYLKEYNLIPTIDSNRLPSWLSGKEPTWQCRSCEFDSRVRKIPWRRKQPPTPVFLPGKSHGQRSLVGYSPWGCKET